VRKKEKPKMIRRIRFSLLMLFTAAALGPALASPLPIGSIVGSQNAVLDGQQALPHTAVLSGDNLQVRDGMALVTLDQGNRMILGRESEASFSRGTGGITVSLRRGNISLFQSAMSTGMQVNAGGVTVAPAKGEKTLGEIAMVDGLVVVTAKDGTLRVDGNGATQDVSKGKTITIPTKIPRAPAPSPSGNRHLNRKRVMALVAIAGGTAATLTAIALTRSSPTVCPQNQASPATPPPPGCP
jgi:hypothetical protein